MPGLCRARWWCQWWRVSPLYRHRPGAVLCRWLYWRGAHATASERTGAENRHRSWHHPGAARAGRCAEIRGAMIEQLATRYGTMFVPDTDEGQYWWLANTGASPEDDCIELICNLLDERPKATAVDVGANFGCWTLPLSRHAHSVLAIEPQAGCVRLLKQSLVANNIRNVRLYMAAADSLPGTCFVQELDFDVSTNFGGVSLLR